MNADGSNQRRITEHSADDTNPAFAPDGETLVFSSIKDDGVEVLLIDRRGGAPRRLASPR